MWHIVCSFDIEVEFARRFTIVGTELRLFFAQREVARAAGGYF
jgi:hypothetical protein